VDWAVARRIVAGWVLTLPAAGLTAAIVFRITDIFGTDSAIGPAAVTLILAIVCFFLWRANNAAKVEPEEVAAPPVEEPTPALEPVGA
jgi:inorganic phosphate transporter, PiT family